MQLRLLNIALCVASRAYAQSAALDATGNATIAIDNVSAYCNTILQDFYRTYVATELATTLIPGYEGFGPTDANGRLTGPVTSQSFWTSTRTYTEYPIRAYTAKPPCCSECRMSAGTMQLIYWPDQQRASVPTGAPVTFTNDVGFTFTSPSVYMAFSKLYASNKCGTVGSVWENTTLAFHATEITTLNPTETTTILSTQSVGGTTRVLTSYITSKPPDARIDYDMLTGDCAVTSGYYSYWPGNPFNGGLGAKIKDPCRPILKVPDRLLSAQQAWVDAGCKEDPGSEGFYDPPLTLDSAQGFARPTFAATTGEAVTTLSQPSQTATRQMATPTGDGSVPASPSSSKSASFAAMHTGAAMTARLSALATLLLPLLSVFGPLFAGG